MAARFKVFLINLESSKQRLLNSQQLLKAANVDFERLDAVNGSLLSQSQIDKIYQFNQGAQYYKTLSKGEIGCYLSHRKAWQKIVTEQLDFAVILEDDFASCGQLGEVIRALENLKYPWDYIKLAEHSRKRNSVFEWQQDHLSLCIYDKVPARTLAQAVSLTGAKKLLVHSEQITRPIDIDLQHWWEKDLSIFGLSQVPVTPNLAIKSEISELGRNKSVRLSRAAQFKQRLAFKIKNRRETQRLVERLKQNLGK
ncbi:glycosyltransferase family 25 protein [Aliikangiella marina]|uniref:Glycosyltransferase family 25 protein n=1 Tax=Aliikangiella marina TaxID=1712262 RepID=A0A545TH29_9GAMM|nr:glycosyltransferase family 25 protein [Aliikangiella marina]TQV76515.1 glycosyltransferase family 25 protein [Aliikangiella marina]